MTKLPGAITGARIVRKRFVHSQRQQNPEGRMPFMDHIRELRNRVVKIALALIEDLNPKRFMQKHSPATWTRTREPSSSPRAGPRRTARSSRRANRPIRPLTTKTKRSPSDPRSPC